MMRKKRVGIIVQARMSSTRLPGKVMKKISGKPMLEHIVERLLQVKKANKIIIATTVNKSDDKIVNLAQAMRVNYFRGNENDVLGRYYDAAKKFHLDVIVRITSDCPVIDPHLIETMLKDYLEGKKIDCFSNALKRTYPRGLDVEIFSFQVLAQTEKEAKTKYQREHVTPYIYGHPEIFKVVQKKYDKNYANYRLTVDTKEDLELIRKIYKELYNKKEIFLLNDILDLLKRKPGLVKINQDVRQKELGE